MLLSSGACSLTLPRPPSLVSLTHFVYPVESHLTLTRYDNNVTIQGPPTNTNPAMLTMNVKSPGSDDDIYASHPWRAPGTTPVRDPCGSLGFNHNGTYGKRGTELDATSPKPVWTAGRAEEVSFALFANHGGGYQYRLCPSGRPQTEACFQRSVLPFEGSTSWVQVADDTSTRNATPAKHFTTPSAADGGSGNGGRGGTGRGTGRGAGQGTVWARNPIPNYPDWPEWPPAGGFAWGHQNIPYNVIDRVRVPLNTAPGNYTLSWRWDCEQTPQVWLNCADVHVVSPAHADDRADERALTAEAAATATAASEAVAVGITTHTHPGTRRSLRGAAVSRPTHREAGTGTSASTSEQAVVLPRARAPRQLPQARVVWRWARAEASVSGGVLFSRDNKTVHFGTLLSTGSATPGTNRSYWALDVATGDAVWSAEVPTGILYKGVNGNGVDGVDGIVYLGTLGPWVYALNASSGAQVWRYGVSYYTGLPADDFFSSPCLWRGTLFIGNFDNHLYAIDTHTGTMRWRYDAKGPCDGSPVAVDGMVYFTSRYDWLTALNATTGGVVWRTRQTSGGLFSSPSVVGGTLFIGTEDGTLAAYDAKSGEPRWSYHTPGGGGVWTPNGPAVDVQHVDEIRAGETVAAGSNSGTRTRKRGASNSNTDATTNNNSLNNTDDTTDTAPGAGVRTSTTVTVVYFGCEDGHMYAVDGETGALKWRFATGGPVESTPVVDDGVVYFGSFDRHVYAVDARTGEGIWQYPTGLYVSSMPAVRNKTVYMPSYDGSFYALRGASYASNTTNGASLTTGAEQRATTAVPAA